MAELKWVNYHKIHPKHHKNHSFINIRYYSNVYMYIYIYNIYVYRVTTKNDRQVSNNAFRIQDGRWCFPHCSYIYIYIQVSNSSTSFWVWLQNAKKIHRYYIDYIIFLDDTVGSCETLHRFGNYWDSIIQHMDNNDIIARFLPSILSGQISKL